MKEKSCYISLARLVCAFAVVMIHVNRCYMEFDIENCWFLGVVVCCGLGFAVPVFIMISGATLIDYSEKYSTKEFFKRRVIKILIPYFVWNIIGTIFNNKIESKFTMLFLIYFFFINLFSVYLSMPVLTAIKKELKEKVFLYLIGVSFLISYLIPFLCKIFDVSYIFKIPFEMASGFIIYALLGYLIHKKDISFGWRLLSYLCSVIGFVLHIGGTYAYSVTAGEMVDVFQGYTNLPCLLSTVGVFIFLKQVGQKIKNKNAIDIINKLSEYTFAIYLIHYYVLQLRKPYTSYEHSIIYIVGESMVIYVICIAIAWIIKKIPIVKKILP